MSKNNNRYLTLLDELQSIARVGLHYSRDPFDRERYQRLFNLAVTEYADLFGLPETDIAQRFKQEVGYITPKVGVAAIIFNEEGRILLVKRAVEGSYCLPGGFAEVGQTPQQSILREVWEETGLNAEIKSLFGVYCLFPEDHGFPHTLYSLTYHCAATGGTLTPSHETPEVGFYDPATIDNWYLNHQQRVRDAYTTLNPVS